MNYLFEHSDMLGKPIECFIFDASAEEFPVKPHWHYFIELIYMNNGSAEMISDGKSYILSEGEMILFHPKSVHSIYAIDDRLPVYSVFKFDINLMNLTSSYAPKLRSLFSGAQKNGMNIFFSADSDVSRKAESVFSTCIYETQKRDYSFDLIIKAEIYELLIGIVRYWKSHGFLIDSTVFADDDKYDIYTVTEYIDENISNGIRVADVATKCRMSYSCFAKHFLKTYGKTCKQYIDEMRVYRVEDFLAFTDFDLNYISQESGFSDCSHMIKSFKKLKGITPKQFRILHTKSAHESTVSR